MGLRVMASGPRATPAAPGGVQPHLELVELEQVAVTTASEGRQQAPLLRSPPEPARGGRAAARECSCPRRVGQRVRLIREECGRSHLASQTTHLCAVVLGDPTSKLCGPSFLCSGAPMPVLS